MQQTEQNEIFELAYRFVSETNENIFLTGKAGTGKTTFLKYLKEHVAKNIVVAAPTGVAAINAGGVTLHSLFQLPFHPFLPNAINKDALLSKLRSNKQKLQLLRKMDLLVIDEISMVRCDTLDAIDTVLRSVRRNYQAPFGGAQVLYIGDLYQLPPVAQQQEWNILSEYYQTPFFFDSLVIKEQKPLLIELNKVYRQRDDAFVDLLNKVRTNNLSAADFEILNSRFIPGFYADPGKKFITLTSHNNIADNINQQRLSRLAAPPFTYNAVIEGDFPENMYPAEAALVLREGAQVMFLKNDAVAKKYFNGKIGVVLSLEKDKILVDCDGETITVALELWQNSRYTLNRGDGKLEQEVLGTFSQYPLRLAWAITIHKSQGLTFENVMIDAALAFSSGQVYVALSRCTSMDGIVLLNRISQAAITSNENINKGQQSLIQKGSLAERFSGARQAFTQELLETLFMFDGIVDAANTLDQKVKEHAQKLNANAAEWVSELRRLFWSDRAVGIKFTGQVAALIKDEPMVEKNGLLQKRISDAAAHFIPKQESCLNEIKNHPLFTEHKDPAIPVNEALNELALAVYNSIYFLQYCKEPFSITGFLQHKIKYIQPKFNLSCYAASKTQTASSADTPHVELYNTLLRWRDMVCREEGLAVYMVANQATIKEICTYLPLTKKDLLQISGFGKAKVEKYGDEVLSAVDGFCQQHQLVSNMFTKEHHPKKEKREKKSEPKKDTRLVSFNLYKEGKRANEIAAERNLTEGTVLGHLAYYVASGDIQIDELVSKQKLQLIQDAVQIHGILSLKTLVDNLPGDISYGDIRLVLAATEKTGAG
ncbi:MAG: helix-turn-helix domain-containing protein [Ferruginibacter sp.]